MNSRLSTTAVIATLGALSVASCSKAVPGSTAANAAQAAPAIATAVSETDTRKLAAAESFEKLTEGAPTAPVAQLDTMIAEAKTSAQGIKSVLSKPALASLTDNLANLATARGGTLNRTDVAIASIEIYRTLVTDRSHQGAVPNAVNLLDYAGFRYGANLAGSPVRWSDMAAAVGIAETQWQGLGFRITDPKLRTNFTHILVDMKAAVAKRDAALAAKSVKIELDLVDALEKQFAAPSAPAKV